MTIRTAALLCLALGVAAKAPAQDHSGLYSSEGIEVRADQRVYTLFALFNTLGYDAERERGPQPLKAPGYSEIRREARAQLAQKGDALKIDAAAAFVEENQRPLSEYLRDALRLQGAPDYAIPTDVDGDTLQKLADLLKGFHAAGGGELYDAQRPKLYESAKQWVAVVDDATATCRSYARIPDDLPLEDNPLDEDEEVRITVVVNPLDSHGVSYALEERKLRYFILGPPLGGADKAADPVVVAAVVEMMRPHLVPALKKIGKSSVRRALSSKGLKLKKTDAPYEVFLTSLAHSFASAALKRELNQPAGVEQPQRAALLRATDSAVAWYSKQKEPFPALAGQLVARSLGTKSP